MATFLLDTCVIIDALNNKRGRPALLLDLVRSGHVLACCPINITEVYAGMRPKEEAATEGLLASLQHLPITPAAARLAGEFKGDYAQSRRRHHCCRSDPQRAHLAHRQHQRSPDGRPFALPAAEGLSPREVVSTRGGSRAS